MQDYYILYTFSMYTSTSVFLISLYGAPLAQGASYLALHSSLFGPVVQLITIILETSQFSPHPMEGNT